MEGLVGNGQNPHDILYWEHGAADYAGGYHHRSVTGSYWPLKFTSLPVDQWVSLGVTFLGTEMHGWKNGELAVSNTTPGMAGAAGNDVYADVLGSQTFGGGLDSSSQWLEGEIAERAIWNVALSAVEMAALGMGFRAFRIRPQNLVFYSPGIRGLQDLRGGRTLVRQAGVEVFTEHPSVR
ncbi:hypothetical protein QF205_11020 [Luteimonas composti]|uniref:LamG domain-containing protein n=1 Tax=Luteimonas composti TaxID=398257 RepID=A0ABT6MT43_9GAMM|nr:hypothetical protein [Luteimonas composti]MDH7453594.1 hypothetical protein [Luteimonas composti]